jgi:hypothetical protein
MVGNSGFKSLNPVLCFVNRVFCGEGVGSKQVVSYFSICKEIGRRDFWVKLVFLFEGVGYNGFFPEYYQYEDGYYDGDD